MESPDLEVAPACIAASSRREGADDESQHEDSDGLGLGGKGSTRLPRRWPGPQEWKEVYRLDNADYRIEMTVHFFPPYLGKRLTFSSTANPGKELCYSGNGNSSSCMERFVGLGPQLPTGSSRGGRACRRRRGFEKS